MIYLTFLHFKVKGNRPTQHSEEIIRVLLVFNCSFRPLDDRTVQITQYPDDISMYRTVPIEFKETFKWFCSYLWFRAPGLYLLMLAKCVVTLWQRAWILTWWRLRTLRLWWLQNHKVNTSVLLYSHLLWFIYYYRSPNVKHHITLENKTANV